MLHFCKWPDRTSLLVDAESKEQAVRIVTELADGEKPRTVTEIPAGVFRAEVVEGDGDYVELDLMPETGIVFSEIEDADTDVAPHLALVQPVICNDVGEGPEGEDIMCAKAKGHAGQHETSDGALEWS